MKVKVIRPLNIREKPDRIKFPVGAYDIGEEVEILETHEGEMVENGNNKWYKIKPGAFIWSGGTSEGTGYNLQADPSVENINYNKIISGIPDEWRQNQGENVTIVIIDTGILANHEIFNDKTFVQYNIFDNIPDANDLSTNGHGTHCAGLIAGNNKVIGIAPKCRLIIINASENVSKNSNGNRFSENGIKKALEWLWNNHSSEVDIINFSLSFSTNIHKVTIEKYLSLFHSQGTVIIAANREQKALFKSDDRYPASYEHSIAIGCMNNEYIEAGTLLAKSDYILPYTPFLSSINNAKNSYGPLSGSSMATALFSGLVALIISNLKQNGISYNKKQIVEELKNKKASFQLSKINFHSESLKIYSI